MFKQFFVGFLAFAFVSVQANAASNNSLKTAFDELNFALTVQGDSNNVTYRNEQMKKFSDKIEKIQKTEGVTDGQLVDFAVSQVKDAKVSKELQTAYSMIQVGSMPKTEARKLVLDTLSKSYSRGASWSADGLLLGGLVVLFIVVAIAAAGSGSGSGASVGGGSVCYDDYVCDDYYDGWGYYWYSDCYYETYCY